ncbi:MAG: lipid II flippase MurJ, partial [Patescibacteria group bacterium]
QSYNKFFIYALSPIFYNLGIIFGIVFLFPFYGINGIAVGVVFGAFMHLGVQIPVLIKLGFFPAISLKSLKANFSEIWKVAKLSFPRTFGLGLNQLIFVFVTVIASFLGAGSIAVFNLSFSLQSVPLAVVGVSYSVAAFPILAKFFVNNQRQEFVEHAISAARQIVFWSIPIMMLTIVLRAQIVRVVLGSGRFDWQDTRLTAAALALFAVSITAQSLIILFVRSFYAAGKTWKPVFINAISSVFIIGLSLWFVRSREAFPLLKSLFESILRVEGVEGTAMLMLPLAFSVGMVFNVILLFYLFQKDFGSIWVFVRKAFFQVLTASLFMSIVCYFFLGVLGKIFDINTFIGIFSQGLVSAILGGGTWYFILRLIKNKELEEIVNSLKQKFWRTPIIAPEPEVLDR